MKTEVKRTMKTMSIMEKENSRRLDAMLPSGIPGRFQILTKLKDITKSIDSIEIIPVSTLPSNIIGVTPFFSTDGFWEGNFIAYGTCTDGEERLLWDDIMVKGMKHEPNIIDMDYIKSRFTYKKDVVIITSRKTDSKSVVLELYYYSI